jgi:hypothetical protein
MKTLSTKRILILSLSKDEGHIALTAPCPGS